MRVNEKHVNIDYQKTKDFFKHRAEKFQENNPYSVTMYQDNNKELVRERNEYETEKLLSLLSIDKESEILDVACGIGRWADAIKTDDYPEIRVSLKANYAPISVPLTVDVTTGDMITPSEIKYAFPMLFDDRMISIFAYNLETILAEKLETVLSRNIANTRSRDYYDIHILYALHGEECDTVTLRAALERTMKKRGSDELLLEYPKILHDIRNSDILRKQWNKYRMEYDYAKDISFDDTCNTIFMIMQKIMLK